MFVPIELNHRILTWNPTRKPIILRLSHNHLFICGLWDDLTVPKGLC